MSPFVNPLKPRGGAGYAEALARIRDWTRAAIADEESVISVTELVCAEPGCPPRETVVLVMPPGRLASKIRIHQAMADVTEAELLVALRDAETVARRGSSS